MGKYTSTLSQEEEKALLSDMVSIQEWIDNAIHNKARQCIDKIIHDYTDKRPDKLTGQEKAAIIKNAKIETAAERTKRILSN